MRLTTGVTELAISLANDFIIAGLFMTHKAHIIACVCIYISCSLFNEQCIASKKENLCISLEDDIVWSIFGSSIQIIVNVLQDFQIAVTSNELSLKSIHSITH